MNSPYLTLGVSEQATDTDIKTAYLDRVKDNPPERDPLKFRQIQQAYELIKDTDSRLRYALFHWPEIEFEQLLDQAFSQTGSTRPLAPEEFLKLLTTVSPDKMPAQNQTKPS